MIILCAGSHLTLLPGLVPITLYFLALALTADLVVTELEAGLLARDWVAGVSTLHTLVCQVRTCHVMSSPVLLCCRWWCRGRW